MPLNAPTDTNTPDAWWVYVLLCQREMLYVGIAKDVEVRFKLHCAGRGAFFTRLNKPIQVLAQERHPSRSSALKAEYALKQRKREEKLAWVQETGPGTRPAGN